MAKKKKKIRFSMQPVLYVLVIGAVLGMSFMKDVTLYSTPVLSSDVTAGETQSVPLTIMEVVDGDTVKVAIQGETKSVRLIGIDTPETVHPNKTVECFGKEASNKTTELLLGKQVILEFDPSQGKEDKYGRLLAFIFLLDGTNVNQRLLEEGYAYEYTYGTPYKYQADFKAAQQRAENAKLGLWADSTCSGER